MRCEVATVALWGYAKSSDELVHCLYENCLWKCTAMCINVLVWLGKYLAKKSPHVWSYEDYLPAAKYTNNVTWGGAVMLEA